MLPIPELNKKIESESKTAAAYDRLFSVVKCLRDVHGCPWDKEQTPLSMRRDLIEETFEAVDAVSQNDAPHAKEELGDVMLNTTMIAYMYEQNGDFATADAINEVTEKIIRRHPHVFEQSDGKVCMTGKVENPEAVLSQWDKIKETVEGRSGKSSILDEVPDGFPPLLKSYKMQKKASKKGFDWTETAPVVDKIKEELLEVEQASDEVKKANADALKSNPDAKAHTKTSTKELDKAQLHLEEEIGDLLFAVVNYSRHLGIDPTVALSRTNQKFYRRFSFVEQQMQKAGIEMTNEHLKEMDSFWDKAKESERQ